jgi:diadenosine tetraphosphatase ApaH/serine/threonine PP2A family protein phosphatase
VRVAILSDVHANLEALRAVLADCAGQADVLLCLGDVVGYGADPEACLELLAERSHALVAGNHEYAVTERLDLDWFNPYARAAAEWTAARLGNATRAWLAALPVVREFGDATLVHASPAGPEEWDYLLSAEDGYAAFGAFATRLCFVGHTHVPGFWVAGSWGRRWQPRFEEVVLEAGCRYLINVGAVGQPRDHDPRAAYALWDDETRRVTIRRVPYDVAGAQRKILAAGLPAWLAERLVRGR